MLTPHKFNSDSRISKFHQIHIECGVSSKMRNMVPVGAQHYLSIKFYQFGYIGESNCLKI